MKPPCLPTLAAAVLGLAPATAAALIPAERVGAWEVKANGVGECFASRSSAAGTTVYFWGRPDGGRKLIVHNPGWPITGPYRLVSLRGRGRLDLRGEAPNGLVLELGARPAARVAASDSIEVRRPDGSLVEKVDVSGMAAAGARLPGCLARTAKHPWIIVPAPMAPAPPMLRPPPKTRLMAVRARPLVDLATLFSADDYPQAAWQAGEEGRVGFLLLIGNSGRVERCSITSSSGSATLDAATCPLLVERMRFEPARDHRGRPTADRAASAIVWRIPKREPPPPPEMGLERGARPEVDLNTLFTDLDYPSAAIRAGEQGSVGFRISIGTNGRVSGCAITASSGSETLDSVTCRLLTERARFTPARDSKGRPAPGSVPGQIVWAIPDP